MDLSGINKLVIERFQEYVRDLYGPMTPEDFAAKWAEYMSVSVMIAKKYKKSFTARIEFPRYLPKFAGIHYPIGEKPEEDV